MSGFLFEHDPDKAAQNNSKSGITFNGAQTVFTWLVHRSGVESQAALAAPEKAADLLDRLEQIAAEASALKARIEDLVAERLSEDGLSNQRIVTQTDETLDLWQAA